MILDIVSLVIILIFIVAGIKNGAAKVISGFAAAIASFVVSIFGAHFLSMLVYNLFFKQTIISNINSIISNPKLVTAAEKADAFLSSVPGMFNNAFDYFDTTEANLVNWFQSSSVDKIENLIKAPITGIVSVITFILIFALVFFLLKKLFGLLAKVFRLPVIRVVDSLFGFFLGALEGILAVYFIVLIFRLLIPLTGNRLFLFNEEYVSCSYFFSRLYSGGLTSFLQSFLFGLDNI